MMYCISKKWVEQGVSILSEDNEQRYYDVMIKYLVPSQGVYTISAKSEEEAVDLVLKHLSYYQDVEVTKVTAVKDIPEHPLNHRQHTFSVPDDELDFEPEEEYDIEEEPANKKKVIN